MDDFWTGVEVFSINLEELSKGVTLKGMRLFHSGREHRLCAFCGNQNRVYMKRHISFVDTVLCVFGGLFVMAPFVDGFDPRGLGLGAVFIGVAEVFIGLRHRLSLKCGRCGFDPVIYRKSHEEAARIVREHIARRALNPANLLADPVVAAGRRTLRDEARSQARAWQKDDLRDLDSMR